MFIHLCLFSMPCSGTVRGRVGADLPGGGSLDAPGRSLSHGIHHGHDERRLPNLHRGVRDPGREGPPRVRIPTLRHSGSPWGLRRWWGCSARALSPCLPFPFSFTLSLPLSILCPFHPPLPSFLSVCLFVSLPICLFAYVSVSTFFFFFFWFTDTKSLFRLGRRVACLGWNVCIRSSPFRFGITVHSGVTVISSTERPGFASWKITQVFFLCHLHHYHNI